MSSLDPGAPTAVPAPARSLAQMLGRHQIASILSTAVDFGTMTLVVELAGASAVVGTLLGASLGALTNFQLGRHWTFGATQSPVAGQALRYALVSGGSAGLNALGEHGLHDRLGLNYLLARVLVAVLVSLLWNFPLQKRFVFRQAAAPAPRAASTNERDA
jgi:putative flippase GtrA